MGNRLTRHEKVDVTHANQRKSGAPRKSIEDPRRRSAEVRANGEVHAYREEDARWAIPDSTEGIPRLHVQHYLMRYLYQANFSAPVHEVLKSGNAHVLDLGCGAGTWAEEVAKEYPDTQVTGVDVSKFFPDSHDVKNLKFIEHDFLTEQRLQFEDNTFDLVHMRFFLLDMTTEQFKFAIRELVRVTKPGGWVELLEFDVQHFSDGPSTRKLTNGLSNYLTQKGHNPAISDRIPGFLKETKQVGVVNQRDKAIPLGTWASRVGTLAFEDTSRLFNEIKELPDAMGVSQEEYQELLASYKVEVEEKRTFFKTHRFFTQKNV